MTRALLAMLLVLAWSAASVRGARAQDEGEEDALGLEDDASNEETSQEPASEESSPEEADDDASGDEALDETSPADDVAEPEPSAGTQGRAIALHAAAGLGFGTVSFERPTTAGVQAMNETPFAAAEVLIRVRAWPRQRFSLEAALAYHSSLGLRLSLAPLFALPESIAARVERGELSLAPVLRLGADDGAFAIAVPIGFAFQSLLSEVHQYQTPHYVVGGPTARAELLVELGEIVELRAGPELQWIVLVSSSLREEEACCQGFAFGGQCAIEAAVGPHVAVALAYRQLHSLVPAPGMFFEDVERFLTARIAGKF